VRLPVLLSLPGDVRVAFFRRPQEHRSSGQLINFSKNMAIWGGLIFMAATAAQPSQLPRE